VRLEDFFRPVESLTDRELVEQAELLKRIQERRRRRATSARDEATVRRLLDSIDEPEPGE
jgi:hypothetical protein